MKSESTTEICEDEEVSIYEDIYESCCEMIDPHIHANRHGLYSITKDSLIPSVVESLQYLIEFWLANKDKEGADLCGRGK